MREQTLNQPASGATANSVGQTGSTRRWFRRRESIEEYLARRDKEVNAAVQKPYERFDYQEWKKSQREINFAGLAVSGFITFVGLISTGVGIAAALIPNIVINGAKVTQHTTASDIGIGAVLLGVGIFGTVWSLTRPIKGEHRGVRRWLRRHAGKDGETEVES